MSGGHHPRGAPLTLQHKPSVTASGRCCVRALPFRSGLPQRLTSRCVTLSCARRPRLTLHVVQWTSIHAKLCDITYPSSELTVPRRTMTHGYTGSPRIEIRDSMFDPGQAAPPRLPPKLDPQVRRIAKRIAEQNRHLDDSHTDAIVRLAKSRVRAEQMEAELEKAGFVTFDAKRGREVAHPLVPLLNQTLSGILAQERALCLTFRAKTGEVREAEKNRTGPVQPKPAQPNSSDGPRRLHLA